MKRAKRTKAEIDHLVNLWLEEKETGANIGTFCKDHRLDRWFFYGRVKRSQQESAKAPVARSIGSLEAAVETFRRHGIDLPPSVMARIVPQISKTAIDAFTRFARESFRKRQIVIMRWSSDAIPHLEFELGPVLVIEKPEIASATERGAIEMNAAMSATEQPVNGQVAPVSA